MGFLDELRMSNIFNPGALSGLFPPIERKKEYVQPEAKMGPAITPIASRIANQSPPAIQPQEKPMDVIFQPSMTDYERATLKQGDRRIDQAGALGAEKLDLQERQTALNELKNQQIYETKIADATRRSEESAKKLELAYSQLQQKKNDAESTAAFKQAQFEAQDARFKLEMAQKDAAAASTARLNDARIQGIKDAADRAGVTVEESEVNAEGTRRTTTTKRGTQPPVAGALPPGTDPGLFAQHRKVAADREAGKFTQPDVIPGSTGSGVITMMGPDGKRYAIPENKVNESVENGMKFVDPRTGKVK